MRVAIASLSRIARSSPKRSSSPEPSSSVRSCSRARTIRMRPRKCARRARARVRRLGPETIGDRRADFRVPGMGEPDPRKRTGVHRQRRDHPRARRHSSLRPAPGNGDGVLRLTVTRAREVSVVGVARNVVKRAESPVDLRRIERQQAPTLERSKRSARARRRSVARLRPRRCRARTSVCSGRPRTARRPRHDREAERSERPLGRARMIGARSMVPEAGSRLRGLAHAEAGARARGGFRRGGRRSYPGGGSTSGPRNSTSCRSSTPNCSSARLRASTMSAIASAVRARSAFSMKFA